MKWEKYIKRKMKNNTMYLVFVSMRNEDICININWLGKQKTKYEPFACLDCWFATSKIVKMRTYANAISIYFAIVELCTIFLIMDHTNTVANTTRSFIEKKAIITNGYDGCFLTKFNMIPHRIRERALRSVWITLTGIVNLGEDAVIQLLNLCYWTTKYECKCLVDR